MPKLSSKGWFILSHHLFSMAISTRWKSILQRFAGLKVLVVGDMMLDQYIIGRVSRISPDAPVPVVDVQSEKFFPGGASNVARNLRSLSASVTVMGVVGEDVPGRELSHALQQQGIETDGLLEDFSRPTTLKTRIIAQHQQVVRFDRESRASISGPLLGKALEFAARRIPEMDAVIFEDYGKGFVQQRLLDSCVRMAQRSGVHTFGDPNAHHRLEYKGLTGITPNRSEAFWMANEILTDPVDNPLEDRPLLEVGCKLLQRTKVKNLLVTLSEHGMCLFRAGKSPHHIPTAALEVFDASGAGDTAISLFALGISSGLDPKIAANLSNIAAGIVVGKSGTATVNPSELLSRLSTLKTSSWLGKPSCRVS